MSKRSVRPSYVKANTICIACGKSDLITDSNKCRICDPVTFYKTYKPTK